MPFLQILGSMIPFPFPSNLLITRLNIPNFSPIFYIVIHGKGADCLFLKVFWILLQKFSPPCSEQPKILQNMAFPDFKTRVKSQLLEEIWGTPRVLPGAASLSPGPMVSSSMASCGGLMGGALPFPSEDACAHFPLLRATPIDLTNACNSTQNSRFSILSKSLISTTHLCSYLLICLSPLWTVSSWRSQPALFTFPFLAHPVQPLEQCGTRCLWMEKKGGEKERPETLIRFFKSHIAVDLQ